MAVYSGSYVPYEASTLERVNYIVDTYLTPRMLAFRQINIHDEQAVLQPDGVTWRCSYGNWNPEFPFVFRLNGGMINTPANINFEHGMFEIGVVNAGDNVNVYYNFDYFPVHVLEGFLRMSVDTINTGAFGPPSAYNLEDAPDWWDGVIADLAFALAMERLILDYDLWYGRVIFAIHTIEDGGDVLGPLETLKSNAEERAYKTLDNEKFKIGNQIAGPTVNYYRGIRGFGRSGVHTGSMGYGKTRGVRINRYR